MKKICDSVYDFLRQTDIVLWILTVIAIIYSFLLISSMQRSGDYNYMRTQIVAVIIGLIAAVIISAADYKYLIQKWYFSAIVAVILSVLVFCFGMKINGTDDAAWINIPGGFTVQPSELIKVCFIITFSKHISYLQEKNYIKNPLGVFSILIHALIPMLIIHFQGEDGTVLVFALMFLIISFMAGVQLRYFAVLGALVFGSIPVIWNFFMNDEHRNRVVALFDIDGNALTNYGWQQYQGKVSIAGGGLIGSGLYNGQRVEYNIVPEQENDFIFTVAGEELGFIGCIILILILLLISIRVLMIIKNTNEFQGKVICYGVFAMITSQSILNLGMVLGLLPVIGITLPLFSAGGTSALSTIICLGLVQSVKYHQMDDMDTAFVRRGSQDRIRI